MVNDGGREGLTSHGLSNPPAARSNIFAKAKHRGEQSREMARRRASSAIAGTFAVFAVTAQRASRVHRANSMTTTAPPRVARHAVKPDQLEVGRRE
jgi:hypothetical protein